MKSDVDDRRSNKIPNLIRFNLDVNSQLFMSMMLDNSILYARAQSTLCRESGIILKFPFIPLLHLKTLSEEYK